MFNKWNNLSLVKGGKMVDRQDDESRLVSTLCPANMQIWVNGVIGRWGAVQGWEGKCNIANLSFILTPRHLRPLWGWAMMSTSAWYRCLRQHCRPIAIKSDQAFYVRQDYSLSILNLLLFCWKDIFWNGRRQKNSVNILGCAFRSFFWKGDHSSFKKSEIWMKKADASNKSNLISWSYLIRPI